MINGSSKLDESDQDLNNIGQRGNVVFRQELRSLTPKCTLHCVMITYALLMTLFLIIGLPIVITENKIHKFSYDYTNCQSDSEGFCTLKVNTNKTIPAPVYFYYEIDNFYMNHRDFVKSRSFPQLRGEDIHDYSRCDGAKYNKEIFDSSSVFVNPWGVALEANAHANPCGLIAKSYFNDSDYSLTTSQGKMIYINDSQIANYYDVKYMFKRNPEYNQTQWIDVENRIIKIK